MRYAIIADIHANLEALAAVLVDASKQHCTLYAFLGDFVGYCADPKACIDIVRAMNAPCVKGNHDEYCSEDIPLTDFTPAAAKAIEWTRKQLSADDCRWLKNLPYVVKLEDFTMVHSTLNQPNRWQYVFDNLAAAASFEYQDQQVCFYGHTHLPLAFVRDKAQVRGGTFSKISIENSKRYYVNSGSVGQSRDIVGKAAYVVYDVTKQTVELRRVDFDYNETVRKMRQAGLY